MKVIKKAVLLMLAVCLLAGVPAVSASAAACDHRQIYYKQWTGQYKYSSYDHTVVLGKYADGTFITAVCHVNCKSELWLMHCSSCDVYIMTGERNKTEAHNIIHD